MFITRKIFLARNPRSRESMVGRFRAKHPAVERRGQASESQDERSGLRQEKVFANMRNGFGSLAMVLLLGGIVLEIGVVGIVITNFLSAGNVGTRLSVEALAAANSGVTDGFMRLLQGNFPDCPSLPQDSDTSCSPYAITGLGNASVGVTLSCLPIEAGLNGSCADGENPTITAEGNALGRHRTFVAVVEVDTFTKVAHIQSIQEAL